MSDNREEFESDRLVQDGEAEELRAPSPMEDCSGIPRRGRRGAGSTK